MLNKHINTYLKMIWNMLNNIIAIVFCCSIISTSRILNENKKFIDLVDLPEKF